MLPPGGRNAWVVPAAGAAAARAGDGDGDGDSDSDGSNDADFLSTPLGGNWRTRSPAVPSGGGGGAGAGAGGVLRGGAPAAAICTSEAVSCGAPSLGLRVVLEIVRPVSASASAAAGDGAGAGAGEAELSSNRGSVGGGGGGGGCGGQAALYRAIAVLVAANRKSPLTRPVVVLTDLCGAWKIIWLGGARSGVTRRGEGGTVGGGGGGGAHAACKMSADRICCCVAFLIFRMLVCVCVLSNCPFFLALLQSL